MHKGSCLCGGVRYEIEGELGGITLCHCEHCRKGQGTAFVAAAPVQADRFRFVAGESLLTAYESSPGKERVFCSRCGSPLFSRRHDKPEVLRLRPGTLDTPVGARPIAHIWTDSRADWDRDLDSVPAYGRFEPGRG